MRRVAITGSSGIYGQGVIAALRERFPQAEILGLDVVEPAGSPPDQFVQCDVVSEALRDHLRDFAPDTVIHLAFVVNPIRDDSRMHQINVGGSRNVLEAAREIQPKRLLVSSSATAYGSWPDNPVPMAETWPLRARQKYRYADDKCTVERLLQEFSEEQPGITVSWTRPSIIYGPNVDNYLIRFILNGPFIARPGGNNTELQFVHIDDVSKATLAILENGGRGPFNVAPEGWVTLRDIARLSGRFCLPVPLSLCLAFTTCWWKLRLPIFHFPAGLWYFVRYPWVVSSGRLTSELGFRFQYTNEDTLRQLLADAGKLSRKASAGGDGRDLSLGGEARETEVGEIGSARS